MNIYEKLNKISDELKSVEKNLEVGIGAGKYKAVGEGAVLRAIKPLETKYGIYSYPSSRRIVESGMIESINSKGEVKKSLFERIETVYRFVNIEKPEEYIEITSYGDGIDSADKSVGKAMTYADKYALLKAYKIITGDDPDQEPSEPLNNISTNKVTKPLDTELLRKAEALDINLKNIAVYFKKDVNKLTNDDLKTAIEMKLKRKMEKPQND